MSPLEALAVMLGLVNIILIIRRSIWNYPFALVMVTLYARIFWDAKLYSDAGLQVFFFVVNLVGWWAWARNRAAAGEIIVERLSVGERTAWIAGSLIITGAWGTVMARLTDASYPYVDASVAMLSVAAQILMTQRKLDNWHWWIIVNILSIGLYAVKGLILTMALYGVFLGLAIWGLITWQRAEKT